MAKGVVFPPSFYEAVKCLEPLERLSVYEAVLKYGLYGTVPDLSPALKGYFLLMQPVIDASQRRYAAAVENGKKGGAPKGNQNAAKHKQPENNQTDNHDYDYDSDSDIDSDSRYGDSGGKGDARGETPEPSAFGTFPPEPKAIKTEQEYERAREDGLRMLENYQQRGSISPPGYAVH